jgi:hypothetical protein
MLIGVLTTTICLLILMFWLRRARRRPAVFVMRPGPYRCVSIHAPAGRCCPACDALVGRRFLPREAPPLPLPDCHRRECRCVYRHHADRRDGHARRASDSGDFRRRAFRTERRQRRERRLLPQH